MIEREREEECGREAGRINLFLVDAALAFGFWVRPDDFDSFFLLALFCCCGFGFGS